MEERELSKLLYFAYAVAQFPARWCTWLSLVRKAPIAPSIAMDDGLRAFEEQVSRSKKKKTRALMYSIARQLFRAHGEGRKSVGRALLCALEQTEEAA